MQPRSPYVSRGGDKLAAALDHFAIDVAGLVCADFGSHVGGFVDCLLQRNAARVHSIDTAYGILAWKLRRDPRVVVMDRSNAMHVRLPEQVDLITIDVGWTKQVRVLPAAARALGVIGHPVSPRGARGEAQGSLDRSPTKQGRVVTLIKPHYEAPPNLLIEGRLPADRLGPVLQQVFDAFDSGGWEIVDTFESPLIGHGGNREVFALLHPHDSTRPLQ